jgi:hypothetical protein
MLTQVKTYASIIRDMGVILGVPAVVTVGVNLYDLQSKALEQQVKSNEAQIKALEAQNTVLKETQFDRALALIKSQKEVYEIEKRNLEKHIADAQKSGDERVAALEAQLEYTKKNITTSGRVVEAIDEYQEFRKALDGYNVVVKRPGEKLPETAMPK